MFERGGLRRALERHAHVETVGIVHQRLAVVRHRRVPVAEARRVLPASERAAARTAGKEHGGERKHGELTDAAVHEIPDS
jgi:hypothetical protein